MILWTIVASIIILILEIQIYPRFIKHLKKIRFSQVERSLGPESHIKKQGTPTMGGVVFCSFIIISALILSVKIKYYLPLGIIMFLFMGIGLYDDYNKVIKKNPDALKAWQKLILQIIATAIFLIVMFSIMKFSTYMILPFTKDKMISFSYLTFLVLGFIILATDNAANLTDGIDGLLSSITIVISIFFIAANVKLKSNYISLPIISIFALLGFLVFNRHKAKIFMGDTGALCIGGYISGMSILLGIELYIPIFGFVLLMEALSVILQVSYFKITKGKRLFKMAPLHHHFEKCGLNENKIVLLFCAVTAVLCLITLILI